MKSTGIVRKIDELGRIVIPKEIRNNLNIKNSESIEICVEGDSIILKKYYKMNNLITFINEYIKIFECLIDSNLIITDREKVITTSKEVSHLIGKKIKSEFLNILEERRQIINKEKALLYIIEGENIESSYIILPILVDGDIFGSIVCLKKDSLKDTDILSANILNYLIKRDI